MLFPRGLAQKSEKALLLNEAISEHPLSQRVGHLKGSLELPDPASDPWRRQVHERNWRP